MSQIIGVTFPIPKQYTKRFFDDGKTVFIKPATCFKELKPGMKFVFYQSHEDTGFVGEGKIMKIAFSIDPLQFFDQFDKKIFLTPEEVKTYLQNLNQWKHIRVRKNSIKQRVWLAIELNEIIKYKEIKRPTRFVPVSGQYLRDENSGA
jgi:hypothetical protein